MTKNPSPPLKIVRGSETEGATERSWGLKADMNGDGVTTISDVTAWAEWLYFYPGDYILSLALDSPDLTQFLEISSPTVYGGWLSGIFSAGIWLVVVVASRRIHGM